MSNKIQTIHKIEPIHEVFLPRAQGLFHLLRQYVPSFTGARAAESRCASTSSTAQTGRSRCATP